MNTRKNRYIIWNPMGEKPPTRIFDRRWKATLESIRLSLLYPGQEFHVLKIKSTSLTGKVQYFGKWRLFKGQKDTIITPPLQQLTVNELLQTTDAAKWAETFCKTFDGLTVNRTIVDVALLTGWFANAIETGRNARQVA